MQVANAKIPLLTGDLLLAITEESGLAGSRWRRRRSGMMTARRMLDEEEEEAKAVAPDFSSRQLLLSSGVPIFSH